MDPLDALRAQDEELAALVDPLDGAGLLAASRCDGWTVADVLLHLAQTDEMAVASVEGRLDAYAASVGDLGPVADVDDLAARLVERERTGPEEARERWQAAAEAQRAAFASADLDARVTWVAGELAARTLATTRLTETWIHTGDIAVAFGPPPAPTDRLWHTARLAWRTLPYAHARAGRELQGAVAFDLVGPDGGRWRFGDDDAPTVVVGSALDLCTVAGQRARAGDTGLRASGPDATSVLELVRTFA
ncbi:MAG: maleylpyruvate isomerase family mycothiol-dependent enzyme [Acidimicrobiales bacterium]|nr:maleylpyruvate isomerase family mycothiol-dependent enzyme [Acidimicrobiales bacterium]HRW38380.1 maleylpyruvate isomerase family mycothiol-dependent enzyme [Aquihabitans sp.]